MLMQIIYILFAAAFGGMFLFVGISTRNAQRRVRAFGIRTQALVIDFTVKTGTQSANSHRMTYYHYPIVRFTDEDGIETTQQLNYTTQSNRLNEYIDILYIKHNENDYEMIIDSKLWKNFVPTLFIVIGAFALLIGVVRLIV